MTEFVKKTIMQLLGHKVGDKFEVMTDESDFKIGEIITLENDDGSAWPKFKNDKGYKWYVDITNVKPWVDTRTPAQKAGIEVGKRYKVAEDSNSWARGMIVTMREDDGSDNPYFLTESGSSCAPDLDGLTLYVPEPVVFVNSTTVKFEKALTEEQKEAIKRIAEEGYKQAYRITGNLNRHSFATGDIVYKIVSHDNPEILGGMSKDPQAISKDPCGWVKKCDAVAI